MVANGAALPMAQVVAVPLVACVFDGLRSEDVFESCVECICELLRLSSRHDRR